MNAINRLGDVAKKTQYFGGLIYILRFLHLHLENNLDSDCLLTFFFFTKMNTKGTF